MSKAEDLRYFADSLDDDEYKRMVCKFIEYAKYILKNDIEAKKVSGFVIPCNEHIIDFDNMDCIFDKKNYFDNLNDNYKLIYVNTNKSKYETYYKELGFELPDRPISENYLPYRFARALIQDDFIVGFILKKKWNYEEPESLTVFF